MPDKEHNMAHIRSQIDFSLFPAGRHVAVFRQRNRLCDTVGNDQQLSAFDHIEPRAIGEIETLPEAQRALVPNRQINRRTDEETLRIISRETLQVAAPGIRDRKSTRLNSS